MIIGIDPGTHNVGLVALKDDGTLGIVATLRLRGNTIERLVQLDKEMRDLLTGASALVALERPGRPLSADGQILWAAYRIIAEAAKAGGCGVLDVAPASAKKILTGNGRALKPAMIAAAQVACPQIEDEHQADAYALALYAAGKIGVGNGI